MGANCVSHVAGPQGDDGSQEAPNNRRAEIREKEAAEGSTEYEFTIPKPN